MSTSVVAPPADAAHLGGEDGVLAPMVPCPDKGRPAGNALVALRTSLAEVLAAQQENIAALHETVDDLTGETDVDSVLAREVAESFSVQGLDVIADIRHALHRIDNGTFGTCERCGNPIALERLEVIPYARRCIACPSPVPGLIG